MWIIRKTVALLQPYWEINAALLFYMRCGKILSLKSFFFLLPFPEGLFNAFSQRKWLYLFPAFSQCRNSLVKEASQPVNNLIMSEQKIQLLWNWTKGKWMHQVWAASLLWICVALGKFGKGHSFLSRLNLPALGASPQVETFNVQLL